MKLFVAHPTLTLFILFTIFTLSACKEESAQSIVDKSIEAHGGKHYDTLNIEFDFRNRHYTLKRKGGEYEYTRAFTDTTGNYYDVLNNAGFTRMRNDTVLVLPEERIKAFSNSVNSVMYFALLPFGLNDASVIKERLPNTTLKGESYHVIKVSFQQEGGGTDFDDEFLYWIHAKKYTVDYLAYLYHTEGGGLRFREAYRQQTVSGILFQDYINYEPEDEKNTRLDELETLYASDKLKELSRIDLENMKKR